MAPFKSYSNANTIAQHWLKWKKSFEFFIVASEINQNARKKHYIKHMVGKETQGIFKTLTLNGYTYEATLNALKLLRHKRMSHM